MLDLGPEQWATIITAVVAVGSLVAQARNSGRQTRLALLERRLAVYTTVRGAFAAGAGVAYTAIEYGKLRRRRLPEPSAEEITEARVAEDEALARFHEAQAALQEAGELAPLLFGKDVVGFIGEVQRAMHDLGLIPLVGVLLDTDGVVRQTKRLGELRPRLVPTFAPYLDRERHAGLRWGRRVELEQDDMEAGRDPLLRPSKPLNGPA